MLPPSSTISRDQLATLAAILHPAVYETHELEWAIRKHRGQVEDAAASLLLGEGSSASALSARSELGSTRRSRKSKGGRTLNGWLISGSKAKAHGKAIKSSEVFGGELDVSKKKRADGTTRDDRDKSPVTEGNGELEDIHEAGKKRKYTLEDPVTKPAEGVARATSTSTEDIVKTENITTQRTDGGAGSPTDPFLSQPEIISLDDDEPDIIKDFPVGPAPHRTKPQTQTDPAPPLHDGGMPIVPPKASPRAVTVDKLEEEPGPSQSPLRPIRNAFEVLSAAKEEDPTSGSFRNPARPPIILHGPKQIEKGLPTCSLHPSPIPPSFASALYLTLLEESKTWERYRWFLAGRFVESAHTAKYFQLEEDAHDPDRHNAARTVSSMDEPGQVENDRNEVRDQYWYAGKPSPPAPTFPPILKRAADIINPFVNSILADRERQPLEFDGPWRANMAAVNHYGGAESSVGWHADHMTYLGPYCTIASLSLGTPRAFRLRPSKHPSEPRLDVDGNPLRTYEVQLEHNSLFIMHAGTQEKYKHTVPPVRSLDLFKPKWNKDEFRIPEAEIKGYNSRINITFRFYRPDFAPPPGRSLCDPSQPREGTPLCRCKMPCVLRADQKAKVRGVSDTTAGDLYTMVFFYQCQSSSLTGDLKGCGFFRLLDCKSEGRGPCIGWRK